MHNCEDVCMRESLLMHLDVCYFYGVWLYDQEVCVCTSHIMLVM